MKLKLYRHLRARARDEGGAVALMTLGYMIGVGLVCVITLWGIGVATGAYNALYGATQTAAYSAVSTVQPRQDGALTFDCGQTPVGSAVPIEGTCTSGAAFNAAESAVRTMLDPAVPGNFNMRYETNAQFTDPNGNPARQIYAYELPFKHSTNRATYQLRGNKCVLDEGATPFRVCWKLDDSVASTEIFDPGVAVYMRGSVRVCDSWACPTFQLRTAASASVSQPTQ